MGLKWFHKRNIQILLLFLLIFAGTAVGSVLCCIYPEWSVWENPTFQQGIGILTEQKIYCLIAPVFWLAVIATLGMSVAGVPFLLCVLLLRGIAFGAVLEKFYLSGISFLELFLIVPYAFLSSFVMILGVREAFRFSLQIAGLLCETVQEEAVSVKLYIIRFLILFIFLLLLGTMQNFLLVKFS